MGAVIFATYMGLTIFNIIYSNRKQREENYPSKDIDKKGLWVGKKIEIYEFYFYEPFNFPVISTINFKEEL